MPDVWTAVAKLDSATQERLAGVLETRGADPQQQAIRRAFLAGIEFPARARVLEVGCGTGVLTRMLARCPGVAQVVGVDAAPSLLDQARELAAGLAGMSFQEADAHALPFEAASFDAVVFDSVLCHVLDPARALGEARRVLRPQGCLAVIDGDYATTTIALEDFDPLQVCADAMMLTAVNDRWLARRLPSLARKAGFEIVDFRSHGYAAIADGYMMTVLERGADLLEGRGTIGPELARALKAEGRRRIEAGTFFGHISYTSLTARCSATAKGRRGAGGHSSVSRPGPPGRA
jgi:SAM-dependent methyltransferase